MYVDYANNFYSKGNMKTICQKITDEYKTEYYESGNSNFEDFEDFADWYINKIINDNIINDYEYFTNTECVSKYEENDILDNVLNYVCDNIDGSRIEASIRNSSYSNSYNRYDEQSLF